MRKPFYKKTHECWYVRVGNRDVRLDENKDQAHRLWAQMLEVAAVDDRSSLAVLVEAFLQEHQLLIPKDKFDQLGGYLASFVVYAGSIKALDVTSGLVAKWLAAPKAGKRRKNGDQGPDRLWRPSTQRDAAGCVKRVYRWALGVGRISRNPLFNFSVSESPPRSTMITPQQHAALVTECRQTEENKPFALYLIASKCGARPQQIRDVTKYSVINSASTWVFAKHKTIKKTKRQLAVYLSPCLQTLTRILMTQPQEHLFTNANGDPWQKDTVSRKMRKLRTKLKLGDGVCAYSYRHTFATEAMLAGAQIATVATLLGHTDTRMVAQRYGHLDQHSAHLLAAAAATAARQYKSG